ncbi:hypothetical protein POX_a01690 [Penicillium oxalicum]|nr:hypothetical protein POX_a01690 [Penicillium oxalicum]KAI2795086.1 hypothetical protein POX_a01690 [Penicillium oxalicum]
MIADCRHFRSNAAGTGRSSCKSLSPWIFVPP